MNIESVKERITALESAGELTIKERIYLYSMKEYIALEEQVKQLAAENAWPRIQDRDLDALIRFNETCEDGEGYDIGEEAMNRLVEIGLCRKGDRRVRWITPFGQWVIDAREGEINLEPLRTESDVNADFSAHIAQLRSQSAPSPEVDDASDIEPFGFVRRSGDQVVIDVNGDPHIKDGMPVYTRQSEQVKGVQS